MKKGCKGQRLSFPDKYLALTISLLLSFVFASAQTITYTPMDAAGYRFKYLKADSLISVPFRDTALGRGTTRPGALVCNTTDSLIYLWNGRKWAKIGTATSGVGTGFVDSVTVSGNQIFYWIAGTGYGKQLNKVDSNKIRNDSLFYVIAGIEHYAGKTSGGIDSIYISSDSAFTCKSGVCTFKFLIDSTIVYTDYTIDVDTTANPGFQTLKVHRASLDSLVHRFVDTGVYIPNNYVLAYDSINHKWHPVNLPSYPGFSLTGYNVDNTDPTHPVILPVQVDGVSITGTGVVGNPFVATQIDTTNKFVNNVTYENDSTLRIWKGATTTVVRTGPGSGPGGGSVGIDSVRKIIATDSIKQYKAGVGTLAFRNNRFFNVKDYGAKGDSITDDTQPIQNAINAAFAGGGGTVYFPNGIYILSSALVTSENGVNPNSQLYIPPQHTTKQRTHVTFLGETRPSFSASALYSDTSYTRAGVILHSTISGSGSVPAVFGGIGGLSSTTFCYHYISFENITLLVKAFAGTTGPTMSGINAGDIASVEINNCVVGIDTALLRDTVPTSQVAGIITSKATGEVMSSVKNSLVYGFRYGIVAGEHCYLDNTHAWNNYAGYVIQKNTIPVYGTKVESQWNAYDILIPNSTTMGITAGQGKFKFDIFQVETYNASVRWFNNIKTISDTGNNAIGFIPSYQVSSSGGAIGGGGFSQYNGTGIYAIPISTPGLLPYYVALSPTRDLTQALIFAGRATSNYKNYVIGDATITQWGTGNLSILNDNTSAGNINLSTTSVANVTIAPSTGAFTASNTSGTAMGTFNYTGAGSGSNFNLNVPSNKNVYEAFQNNAANVWYHGNIGTAGINRFAVLNSDANANVEVLSILQGGNVGINNSAPNASALLDITSTTKGFLPPRMTTTQQNAISSPATGLTVFNSDTLDFMHYTGATWTRVGGASSGSSGSMAIGGAITSATLGSVLYAGTSGTLAQDNANFFWDQTNHRLGIGTTAPSDWIHIKGANSANNQILVESTSASGQANTRVKNSSGDLAQMGLYGSTTSAYGTLAARSGYLYSTGTGPLNIMQDGNADIILSAGTGAPPPERLRIKATGSITMPATNTTTGTTGAQTINKPSGKVNFAAAASTLVVTNSLVTTSSIVVVTVEGTDATATSARVTLAAGSFTITLNAAATAETKVDFMVIN